MFKPLAMKRITLHLLHEQVPAAASALAATGEFMPDAAPEDQPRYPPYAGARFRELHQAASGRLAKVLEHLEQAPGPWRGDSGPVSEATLAELNDWLGGVWNTCSEMQEQLRSIAEDLKQVRALLGHLEVFSSLHFDLALLRGEHRFISLFVGTLPAAHLERLRQSVALAGAAMQVFLLSGGTAYLIVAGPRDERAAGLRALLHTAEFRDLALPPEFSAQPEQVRRQLLAREHELLAREAALRQEKRDCATALLPRLQQARWSLTQAAPLARLAASAGQRGLLARITGWAPARAMERLHAALRQLPDTAHVLQASDPRPDEHPRVPSLSRHPVWLAPFAQLVRQYGTPRYGEADPTLLFALSFCLLFGLMFGDLGQGLALATVGLMLRRRWPAPGRFMTLIGLVSAGFGLLYGSVFGSEAWLHPLWVAPMSDPLYMMRTALLFGAGFILLGLLLSLHNLLSAHRWLEALLAPGGLAGITLYLGLLTLPLTWQAQGRAAGWHHAAALLLPLALMAAHQWRHTVAPFGERLAICIIETFETLLSLGVQTLSFLRVAAFSLNHVALAVAVYAIANSLDPAGHWLTLVLGNVFITLLEGAIVLIQALRLEYYEGFTRYFAGDGRTFEPLNHGGQTA
jgi:V/A-type H+-transporting ATPase subunit I